LFKIVAKLSYVGVGSLGLSEILYDKYCTVHILVASVDFHSIAVDEEKDIYITN
ncbi:27346_t:CDS:1, partial [Racocetra persica]